MEPNSNFIPVEWTTTKGVRYYLNKWKEESNTDDAEFEVIPPLMISDKNVQECDARGDDSSSKAGQQIDNK